jgi:hypothetical protein
LPAPPLGVPHRRCVLPNEVEDLAAAIDAAATLFAAKK